MPGSFMLQALAYGSAPARRRRAMYAYSPSSRSSGTSRRRNRIRPAAMITRVTPPQAFTASRVDRDPSPRQLLCARSRWCAAAGALRGRRPEVGHGPGAGRPRPLERIAVEGVELLERLDQEIVHREPDGAPPVRVAPEEPAGGLGWLVVDPVLHPVDPQHVRVVAVAS